MPIYKYYTAQGCLAQGFTVAPKRPPGFWFFQLPYVPIIHLSLFLLSIECPNFSCIINQSFLGRVYGQIWKYVHPIVLSAQCRRKKMSFLSVPSLRLLCVFWGSFVSLWVGGCAFYEAMGDNNWEVSCSNFDRKYSSVLWQAILYPKIAMIIFWS